MRRHAYTIAAWTGAIGGASYAVEAGTMLAADNGSAAVRALGWTLLGAAMWIAAVARRRALPASTQSMDPGTDSR